MLSYKNGLGRLHPETICNKLKVLVYIYNIHLKTNKKKKVKKSVGHLSFSSIWDFCRTLHDFKVIGQR